MVEKKVRKAVIGPISVKTRGALDLQQITDVQHKSTGPRTESGKARASLNARHHQLTAKTYIAPPEEMQAYDAHCAAWREALQPAGIQERELVEEIARDKWRLKRAAANRAIHLRSRPH